MIAIALLHPLCEGAAFRGAVFHHQTAFDEAYVLLNFKVTS